MFELFSLILARILVKFCRNFADILENVDFFPEFKNYLAKIPEFCSDVWSEKNEGENKRRLCYKEDGKSTEELVYI